jgi:superoxide dismutase
MISAVKPDEPASNFQQRDNALAPYMSRETLEHHHDKHNLAYVNNGNNLAKGTEWENKPRHRQRYPNSIASDSQVLY